MLGTVEEYDPATDTWTARADMPTARALVTVEAVGGRIYAIGGGSSPAAGESSVEEYDPTTDSWTARAPMPSPRSSLCSGVVAWVIYVIGGANGNASSTVEEYAPATDTWSAAIAMPRARWGLSCAVDGSVYAIGGAFEVTVPHPGEPTNEEYDPDSP